MVDFNLKAGMTGEATDEVNENNTALKYGSGIIKVYATPAMIGLMENAAINTVDRHLPEGYASVGTRLDVKHTAATPIGMNITAKAELIEEDGPKLKFTVKAYDDAGMIGEGVHNRYIVKLDEFLKKTEEKLFS